MKRVAVCAVITATALGASPESSLACSCAIDSEESNLTDRQLVHRLFDANDLVAVLEVSELRRRVEVSGTAFKGRYAVLTPSHMFKGSAFSGQTFVAELGGTNTSCEVTLEKGEVILVYASNSEPIVLTECGTWAKLKNTLRSIRYLYEITEPE